MVCCREYFRGEKGGGGPGVDIREVFNKKKTGINRKLRQIPDFLTVNSRGGVSGQKKILGKIRFESYIIRI